MSPNESERRAVAVALLLVLVSVLAVSVAFAGSAAADDPEYGTGAVHYDNTTTANWSIEIPLRDGSVDTHSITEDNITVLDDGEDVSGRVNYSASREESSSGRIVLNTTERIPSNDLEVEFDDGLPEDTLPVAYAAESYEIGTIPDTDTFRGTVVAFFTADGSAVSEFEIRARDDDTDFFAVYGTGTNSSVLYLDTGDLDTGEYDLDGRANLTVNDLGLSIFVDDLEITTDDDITGTIESRAVDRDVRVVLVDSDGDVVASDDGTLDGQREYDFSFDAADLSSGRYTVRATDEDSGIAVESSTVSVGEAGSDDARFANNLLTDQRGDVVAFTVELESTDEGVVTFGSDDQGVHSNVTLVDDDNDGEVTAYLNTTALQDGRHDPDDPETVYYLDADSDDEIDYARSDVSQAVPDLIDAGEYDLRVRPTGTDVGDATDVGSIVLEERGTESIDTWTLPGDTTDPSDLSDIDDAREDGSLTESDAIARGDLVVHEIRASGLEGYLDAQRNEQLDGDFIAASNAADVFSFALEQADPGANQEPWELNLGTDNTSVVAGGDNDTYYVIVDTGEIETDDGDPLPDDERLRANFTVFNRNDYLSAEFDDDEDETATVEYAVVEPEIAVDEPYDVSTTASETVSGETTLAPGTEVTVRVRSTGETSPRFAKTTSTTVEADHTWSVQFDFRDRSVGDTYEIVVTGGAADEVIQDGEVVNATATPTDVTASETATPEPDTGTATLDPDTETATPEPDTGTATLDPDTETATPKPATDTPTSTPGFGVIVALTALLAAALLAVRRES